MKAKKTYHRYDMRQLMLNMLWNIADATSTASLSENGRCKSRHIRHLNNKFIHPRKGR